ncbi:MAG: DUF1801 domain-containing protein [Planctomycetes bacterium]|nr:DUF1801 domain-containing protein [Planctomycetota bacterium]
MVNAVTGKAKPASNVDTYVKKLPADTRAVVEALRRLIVAVAPNAREELKWGQPWYAGTKGVCYIAAFKDHINLGFARGAELPDPAGRLEGTGKGMRHVKIRNPKEIDAAVKNLAREAFTLDAG